MTTLHLGTHHPYALMHRLTAQGLTVAADGDSWDEWGETAGDDEAQHLVVRDAVDAEGPDLLRIVADLLEQDPTLLRPMTHYYQAGTIAVLSSSTEWDQQYHVLVDDEARKQILGACPHATTFPVPSSGRFARVYCTDCHTAFTPEGNHA